MKKSLYQDYVIKDGKFIGEFEKMYREFDDPWHQSFITNSYSRNFTILNILRYKIKSVVEFGCGLGFYTYLLHKNTEIRIIGVDISRTAIDKAKKRYPNLDFKVDNAQNIKNYSQYEAILFAEITWYILDDLDAIFKEMFQHFKGKYFLHNLVFYKGQQEYGTQLFTNLKEFVNYVPFKLIGYSEATTIDDDTIETSTIFKIEEKDAHVNIASV